MTALEEYNKVKEEELQIRVRLDAAARKAGEEFHKVKNGQEIVILGRRFEALIHGPHYSGFTVRPVGTDGKATWENYQVYDQRFLSILESAQKAEN